MQREVTSYNAEGQSQRNAGGGGSSLPSGLNSRVEEVPSGALGIRAETRAIPVRGLEQVAKLIAECAAIGPSFGNLAFGLWG